MNKGWSGGAMVLGKLPVPGRPTIWITVGQGPTALAVGAVGVVWTFLLSSILSFLFLPLFGRRGGGRGGGRVVRWCCGKLPVPGRPTIWMIVGQGPIAFAVGAGGG